MNRSKIGACVFMATMLSACGGGSDSDEREVVRLNESAALSVSEQGQLAHAAKYTISKIEPVSPASGLSVSASGNSVVISASELDHPVIGTYDVYMTKGNDILIERYEVLGVNASAALEESKAYEIRDNYDDLLELAESRKIYQYFVDLAYLSETITPSVRDTRIAGFDVTGEPSFAQAKSAFDSLLTTFDAYLNGGAGEDSLRASVALAEQELATHSASGLAHLRSIEDLSNAYMNPLPDNAVEYVDSQGRFSRFFDESMVTTVPDTEVVVYNSFYQILSPLTGL